MHNFNIISRRSFLDRSLKLGLGVALSSLTDIPLVVKRALAEGSIGLQGKKLLFIFLRGANDALNSVIPVQDTAYNSTIRPGILIPKDPSAGFDYSTAPLFDPTQYLDVGGAGRGANDSTFGYANAINLGNGFAALHPSLKFLVPVYAAGDLAIIHRVGYPKQSRSHFDSQDYWESGVPNNKIVKDGIFYRAIVESGLANTAPLTGVSVQSALPLILRGSKAAMTNLGDPLRYNLLGVPNNTAGNLKADRALTAAGDYPFPEKKSRELLQLQYANMLDTLSIFAQIDFTETGNTFKDDVATDNDAPYYLFPTDSANTKNGGYALHGNSAAKYVVDSSSSSRRLFQNLKAAALVLNNTDAIVAGTEYGGFDTHNSQGGVTGAHANLLRRLGWAIYALRKYFMVYGKGGSQAKPGAKVSWDDLVIVTLSEFGRTTVQNGSGGTDHAEAGVMLVAGGAVKGGIFGCHPNDPVPWITGPADQGGNIDGSMFGVSNRYLKRCYDYRSVLGKLIRDHLGATPAQLSRIIPGYLDSREKLEAGGTCQIDNTVIAGEPPIL